MSLSVTSHRLATAAGQPAWQIGTRGAHTVEWGKYLVRPLCQLLFDHTQCVLGVQSLQHHAIHLVQLQWLGHQHVYIPLGAIMHMPVCDFPCLGAFFCLQWHMYGRAAYATRTACKDMNTMPPLCIVRLKHLCATLRATCCPTPSLHLLMFMMPAQLKRCRGVPISQLMFQPQHELQPSCACLG